MKSVLEAIAKSLVDAPREVQITEIDGEKTVIFELRCNAKDVGKIYRQERQDRWRHAYDSEFHGRKARSQGHARSGRLDVSKPWKR